MGGWTKTALWLLATVALASALFPTITKHDNEESAAIKRAYQQRHASQQALQLDFDPFEAPADAPKRRHKRDIGGGTKPKLVFGNINSACQTPGYTGQHCEFPICTSLNKNLSRHDSDQYAVSIDHGTNFDLNPFAVIIDDRMVRFMIEIQSDPQSTVHFDLKDMRGNVVPFEREDTEVSYIAYYDQVASGTYYVYPSSDITPTPGQFMLHYFIRATTGLKIDAGVVRWSHADPDPDRNDYPGLVAVKGQVHVFSVKPLNLQRPGSLDSVTFFSAFNAVIVRPKRLLTRYGCSYEYYHDGFYCRDAGEHYAKIDGTDFMGNPFRRTARFECKSPTPIITPFPPSTTTPGPITACANNGTAIKHQDGTIECFCTNFFTGRDCSQTICLNGGTPDVFDPKCQCLDGFSGLHCQDVQCSNNNGDDWAFRDPKLVLVIRVRQSMNDVISQLIKQLVAIRKYFVWSDPEYMEKITLVTFSGGTPTKTKFTNFNATIAFLNTLTNSTMNPGSDCADNVFTATLESLEDFITYRSPVYVITDALPDQYEDMAAKDAIFAYDSFWHSPINFIFLMGTYKKACTGDIYSQEYKAAEDIARFSSGQVMLANGSDFGDLFKTHMDETFRRTHLLRSSDLPHCGNQNTWQTLYLDHDLDVISVVATGDDLELTLISPTGVTYTVDHPIMKLKQFGRTFIWWFNGLPPGQYTYQVFSKQPSIPCSIRAYARKQGRTDTTVDYRLFWAWTPGGSLKTDALFWQPHHDVPSSLVVHLEGFTATKNLDSSDYTTPERINAELVIWASHDNKQELVFASNGIWRDGCLHEIYFPPFTCRHAEEDLYFTVYVRGQLGRTIQRSGNAVCVQNQPTLIPPDGCLNGGVMVDDKCLCTFEWQGEHCEKRICFNGGTPNGAVCTCQPGHGGKSCEIDQCITADDEPATDFSPNGRRMAFLIDTTSHNMRGVLDLVKYLPQVVSNILDQDPEWITYLVLISYNSQNAEMQTFTNPKTEIDKFIDALKKVQTIANPLNPSDTNCTTMSWKAIKQAAMFVGKNGYIFNFQSALPDESDINLLTDTYDLITKDRILVNNYIGVKGQGEYKCNGTNDDFAIVASLSEYTEGEVFAMDGADFQHILHTIPSFYSNGLVIRKKFDNCAAKPISIYFPVDSFTQTLQLTYFSDAPIITQQLYKPNGTPADKSIVNVLVADDNTGVYVTDVRKPCEEGWTDYQRNSSCMMLYPAASWFDAQAACDNANAYLADDLENQKNSALGDFAGADLWLGLNDNNEVGKFVWDRGTNNTDFPLGTNHDYQPWDPNANLQDPKKRCVVRLQSDGKWHLDDCSSQKAFVCQKPKFSSINAPVNRVDDTDPLPLGKWRFDIQANLTKKGTAGGCYFEARVQSLIQIYSGFATNEHSDKPNSPDFPVTGSSKNRIITHLSGPAGGKHALTYAMLYDEKNFTFYDGLTYEERRFCAYPYATQEFVCPNADDVRNAFTVVHTGEDFNGGTWQRITTGHCQAAITKCENQGILYQSKCICKGLWQGRTCEIPICVNGGVYNPVRKTCSCNKGWTGENCDLGMCYNQSTHYINMKPTGKTFALVIENTAANSGTLKLLAADLKSILSIANGANNNWFMNYVLVTFNTGSATLYPGVTSPDVFVDNFKKVTANPPAENADSCTHPIYGAVAKALDSTKLVYRDSVVYLVARGSPNDWSNKKHFESAMTEKQPQLYYMWIKHENCSYFKPDDLAYATLSSYVYGSGGNMFYLNSSDLANHMQSYIPTLFDSQVISTPTFSKHTCSQLSQSFEVETSVKSMTIAVHFDKYSTYEVVDPRGTSLELTKTFVDMDLSSYLLTFNSQYPGIYTLNINSDSKSCLVQIRAQHGTRTYTGFIYGEKEPEHQDDPHFVPTQDGPNMLVVHVDPPTSTLETIEIYSENDHFASAMEVRYNCSFEYFSKPFNCYDQVINVVINGLDKNFEPFRHWRVYECPKSKGGQTTIAPGTTTTLAPTTTTTPLARTNTKFDVFLFYDGSNDVKPEEYHDVVNMTMDIFKSFDMSRNGISFSVFEVQGPDGESPLMEYPLGRLSIPDTLRSALKTAEKEDNFLKTRGQTLAKNMKFIANYKQYMSNDPAFTGVSNKVAIYFTTNQKPPQEAADLAKTIRERSDNPIGFMAVAYPSDGLNKEALVKFTGGEECVFVAATSDDLPSISSKIADKIWDASLKTGGKYC